MTMEDREIWREAYSLYDNNKDMPNTYDAWCYYIDRVSAFANAHDYARHPLTKAFFSFLIESVEGNIKKREQQPRQVTVPEILSAAEETPGYIHF